MEEISLKTVLELKSGSEAAFKFVYEAYSGQIFKIAKYILKDDSWSEEIVQETFLKLWLVKDDIDENQSLRAFLYVISKRLCFNRLRNIKNDQKAIEELRNVVESSQKENDCQVRDINLVLNSSVAKLTSRQKAIWMMSREEGLTHKQIATQLDLSLNTVKNHLVQCLKHLRADFYKTQYLSSKDKL